MDEQKKYEIIKGLADHPNPNKERASLTLDCTVRHINRMLSGYKASGKEFFIHGNKGRKPVSTIDENTKQMVINYYRQKYYNSNFTHYTELLAKCEGIFISTSSVTKILESEFILSPKVTSAKKSDSKNN